VPTPTDIRTSAVLVFLAATLLGAAPAHSQCSDGQMAEAQLQFQGAQQLIQTQQWAQVIPQMKSIVDFCPEFFPALRGLGLAYSQTGQFDEAADAYRRVIEVRGDEAEAADYANYAKVLTRQKKYVEARAEYVKAKARDAHNCGVLVNLGILHNASGFPVQAVETLEDALAFCPDLSDRILPQLAKAATAAASQQRQIGNAQRADYFAQKAQEYGGSAGGTTAYQQIQAAMRNRDFARTVTLCEQLVAKEPEHANAWLTLARAADASGDKAKSIDAYRRYLELRPDNMDETAAMIIVMAEAGRCDTAIAEARDAASRFAGTGSRALGKIHFAHGKALFCKQDYAGARERFSLAAASGDPTWVAAAREGVAACDEYLDYEAAQQRQRAQQQGG
jgi:tetratricopeptide (TPR) repeat protein